MAFFPIISQRSAALKTLLDLKAWGRATLSKLQIPARFSSAYLRFQTRSEGIRIMLRWKIGRLVAKFYCGAAKPQLRLARQFDTTPASPGVAAMPRVRRYAVVKPMPPTRMILASFAAGVGAMVFLGLIAPTIANGGLSLRTANAEPFVQQAPLIAPLDVPAIKARLALAETSIEAARHSSDPMMFRLERLAHD